MADKVAVLVEQLSQQNPFNGTEGLADPPRPSAAAIPRDRPSLEQIPYIQQQINILTYNHLPRTFFSLEKHRSLQSILMTAKEALAEALPIRCLEATFLALHFTQCLRDIDRIPLSFKSEANGNTYRHIVLVLRTRSTPSLYGALGLSRKSTLMYKPVTFHSLFDLVMNYRHEYEVLGHELADIKLGIAITHDEHSRWNPCWRFIALKLSRYCGNANGAGAAVAEAHEAAPSSSAHREYASPGSPLTRKSGGHGGEPFSRTPNGSGTGSASSPLKLRSPPQGELHTPFTRGEGHLERSHNGVLCDTQSSSPPHHPCCTPSLGASTSAPSPSVPYSSIAAAATGAASRVPDPSLEKYTPLASLLSNYTRLLPTICEQYYKTVGTIESASRATKLCYMDLDTAEKDAGIENQRRLQCIAEMQSPLSPEARRVAANRQLRSAKKEHTSSKKPAANRGGSGDVSSAKQRELSSNDGRPAKRRSPASPGLSSGDPKKNAVPAATAASPTPRQNRSPRTRPAPAAPRATTTTTSNHTGVMAAPPPLPMTSFAAVPVPSTTTTLAAALAESGHSLRNPLAFEGTTVDAHSICSSISADQASTEGYATPLDGRHSTEEDEEEPGAPPLTPRNYDATKPTTPYDAFLRTPSSSSDLFSSPAPLNNTISAPLELSP
ncbi:hypothetical protein ABB37_09810 [Leptomonas pyrrhocoris]|uniref:Vasohibin-like protein n=1 Tax=Leptomonas pyrrhocoris TaxID=157538 RepID=A0A0M9FPL6_LEPPY|nr:hypothetical protein ABB37_09810 [Leptomonas pyrrhocoris]KPA73490.1 hypothetical protein ABB37_09810 [Leptomonas pyrrhocoris]|eukprot:XP_015651929.1 hypothetical protein ABB37_09810 [Leptomonas pyrrhocoris]